MATRILLTGFGPFPGAPFNPTGPLVEFLVRAPVASQRRSTHVFATAYEAVDRDLPALLARERPDVLIMFGLAQMSRRIRIETLARNVLNSALPDVGGKRPQATIITSAAPPALALQAPAYRLVQAVRATGMPAALSRDAGSYLCNYLSWRTCEAAQATTRDCRARLFTFVHVPPITRLSRVPPGRALPPFALEDLIRAGEAIVRAAAATVSLR